MSGPPEGGGTPSPTGTLTRVLQRARRMIEEDLWVHEPRTFEHSGRALLLVLRSCAIVLFGISREELRLRAAALTYTTLLSLVPALTVVFSTFSAFGGFDSSNLRSTILSAFAVHQQDTVTKWLDDLVLNVNFGALGTVGVLLLVVTVMLLLAQVERALNDIWGIDRDRSWPRKFLAYWPLISLGPVLFGLSLTATASIEASPTVQSAIEIIPALHLALKIGPLLLTCAGFTMMYVIVPNTRVPIRFAAIGGIVGGSLWEGAKVLFAVYAGRAISYSAIYGSLGVVPLTIVWLYLSWLIALSGALVTFAVQNARNYEPSGDRYAIGQRAEERLAVALATAVFARFERGLGASDLDEISQRVPGPPRTMGRILRSLVEGQILIEISDPKGVQYAPGRSATRTSVADVIEVLRVPRSRFEGVTRPHTPLDGPELSSVRAFEEAEAKLVDDLSKKTMADLVSHDALDTRASS